MNFMLKAPIIINTNTGEVISELGCSLRYKIKVIIWIIKNL